MSPASASSPGLRLATGQVTVLLGPDTVRRGLLGSLDPGVDTGVLAVTSARVRSASERIAALDQAAGHRPTLVLVDRVTDGLDTADRSAVLAHLRRLAATGPAVLVDDTDPVAALAVADGALRVGADGSVTVDDLGSPSGRSTPS